MAVVTITWHSHRDDRTCPVCMELDGYQWVFDSGKDVLTDALFHPKFGIVWSLSQGSNAHARGYLSGNHYNCRCGITHDIDAEDIRAKCVFVAEWIKDAVGETL
jgi:hypothetical protein